MTAQANSDTAPTTRHMANALRALAMDAVEAANSGHPGMPMGMADVATVLFQRFLKFDAAWPEWPDRDRFVLSAGHGSMLLYGLLHLTGYAGMSMDELRRFRQIGSKTPGHPEFGCAPGVETTTGPLGQGLATAVGMAIAERHLAASFGADLVDHRTYVIAGDGCLMEGVSQEAISLAGHLRLSRLIVLFDDNQISIDGPTSLATSDDQIARFTACGWNTVRADGHDPESIANALSAAQRSDRPTLIACRTVIGFGAPNKQGTAATHGSPLGKDEIAAARKTLGWAAPPFEIPGPIAAAWRAAGARGQAASQAWRGRLERLPGEQRREWDRRLAGEMPTAWAETFNRYKRGLVDKPPTIATRQASQNALEVINVVLPEMLGGSADLTGSNNTKTKTLAPLSAKAPGARYVHYGVREHAMAAAMNGIALHGGLIPYGGTFLVFADYLRPALRLSALMEQRVIYVLTHDSIGLGEDGPTHQPVEHLAALRAIPHVQVFRPADAVETAECWAAALAHRHGPSVIALSRQTLPALRRRQDDTNRSASGAYELLPATGAARVTLLASGSEVALAAEARERLQADAIGTRVVSMPCWELFEAQDRDYRRQTLGLGTVRIAIEAASRFGWERYIGEDGAFVGMAGFGASAPQQELYRHFGITADAVITAAKSRLKAG
ncbi:MAG: transketolase [Alphaproteobacteria bacterium]|nr:transketolase [Alphaproteobacteria bacterium]